MLDEITILEVLRQESYQRRFWSKVAKSDGCWTWTGRRLPKGYGQISLPGRGAGNLYAHRVSWRLHHGAIPAGLFVCHRCDNRACVNPAHLFLGTPRNNVDDCVAKRRHTIGERHPNARLKEAQVLDIRARFGSGTAICTMAREFGVSKATVSGIISRRNWRHLP